MISLIKKYIIIFLVFSPVCDVYANDSVLKTMVRTEYPENVVKSSSQRLIEYILEGTEYRVYTGKNAPDDSRRILSLKPKHQYESVLMSRIDAILMVIGDRNSIVVDYDRKLISVTRNPIYGD